MRFLFCFLVGFACLTVLSQPIVINEIVSSNSVLRDSDGDTPDWIELYNASDSEINLKNYRIYDQGTEDTPWEFPEVSLASGGYLLLFASDKNLSDDVTNLHLNFKLSGEGDRVVVSDQNGNLADSLVIPALGPDISMGRQPDGGVIWKFFTQSTPGEPNSTKGFESINNPVSFSVPSGFHVQPFQLTLSTQAGGEIFYTTDGSDPMQSGNHYSLPLLIDETTIVRAGIRESNTISGVQTRTYLFDKHDLPVISLTTDPKNLWDYNEGIYVVGPNAISDYPYHGANFWQDWEKPVHMEMFEPDGRIAFAEDAGVKIFGGWSRVHDQKSLAIYFRDEYGADEINYQIFPNMELDRFSHLVLRNSGNDWNHTMFRDGLITSLFPSDIDKQAFRSAVVYINGEYWGIHNIREKVNEDFLADHHHLDPDELTILELDGKVVEGDPISYLELMEFISMNDLKEDQNYEYVKTQVDIDNYVQYYVSNIYADNKDWPGNNIKYWKGQGSSKWRWITFDTDFGFVNEWFNTLELALASDGEAWPNPPWSTYLIRNLLRNERFKNHFINAFADQINTIWEPGLVVSRIEMFEEVIAGEIDAHMNRWGGSKAIWDKKVKGMKYFANARPGYVRNDVRLYFGLGADQPLRLDVNNNAFGDIRLNSIKLESFQWSGIYFEGAPVTLEALPKPGYRFVRWEGDVSSTDAIMQVSLASATGITAVFESYDPGLHSVIVNEIKYSSHATYDTEDWLELYNNGVEPMDISGWYVTDKDSSEPFVVPEGTILPADGYMVICEDASSFGTMEAGVRAYVGNMEFGLSSVGDCLRLYTNEGLLTDEVCYSGMAPWPEIKGTDATLALINPDLDNADSYNWFTQYRRGTPGAPNTYYAEEKPLWVYPNPFQESFTIRYHLQRDEKIRLELYNQQGQFTALLLEGYGLSGHHETQWHGQLKPGLYLIRMVTESGLTKNARIFRKE